MGLFARAEEEATAVKPDASKTLQPPKVVLGDTINHKRYLDECVVRVSRSSFPPPLLFHYFTLRLQSPFNHLPLVV